MHDNAYFYLQSSCTRAGCPRVELYCLAGRFDSIRFQLFMGPRPDLVSDSNMKHCLLFVLFVHSTTGFVNPTWDFAEHNAGTFCVNATDSSRFPTNTTANARLVFAAYPSGPPPATGWPVYFSFVTDSFSNMSSSGHLLPDQACAGA